MSAPMRVLLAVVATMALTLPARAQPAPPEGSSFDEPMPKASPAPANEAPKSPPPPQTETQAPPPQTQTQTQTQTQAPTPTTQAQAPTLNPNQRLTPDGYIEETIPNPSKKWGLAFAGAAAGCFVLGGILGGVALSREAEQTGNPAKPPLYTTELLERGKQADTLAGTAYGFFALGAALVVVDVVLWIETFRKPRVIRRPASEVTMTPSGAKL
jgi:hypothetical protein